MIPMKYIAKNLIRRKGRTILTVAAVASIIAVFAAMNAVTQKMVNSFKSTGLSEEIVIMERGVMTVDLSRIQRETLSYVQSLPQVMIENSKPLVSPEMYLGTNVRIQGREVELSVRGVKPISREVYRQPKVVTGDWPSQGKKITVGQAIAHKYDIVVGDTIAFQGESWTVAGIVDGEGTVYDQEIWADLDELAAVSYRNTYTNYVVQLRSSADARILVEEINATQRYSLRALNAADFYRQSGAMAFFLAGIGKFISFVMAIGAIFGVMNTMYSHAAARRREIAIMKAIGFKTKAILGTFAGESMMLGLAGGVLSLILASGIALVPIDLPYLPAGKVTIGSGQVYSALIMSIFVGLLGGLLPSIQAARLVVVHEIRK